MPPEQKRVMIDHHTGDYVPYSFRSVRGFFNVSHKCCETGPPVLSSLSEKTRKSNYLQMSLQRKHFLLSYLKTLSLGPAGIRTHHLPHGSPALYQLSEPVGGDDESKREIICYGNKLQGKSSFFKFNQR